MLVSRCRFQNAGSTAPAARCRSRGATYTVLGYMVWFRGATPTTLVPQRRLPGGARYTAPSYPASPTRHRLNNLSSIYTACGVVTRRRRLPGVRYAATWRRLYGVRDTASVSRVSTSPLRGLNCLAQVTWRRPTQRRFTTHRRHGTGIHLSIFTMAFLSQRRVHLVSSVQLRLHSRNRQDIGYMVSTTALVPHGVRQTVSVTQRQLRGTGYIVVLWIMPVTRLPLRTTSSTRCLASGVD